MKKLFFAFALSAAPAILFAMDLWQNPEPAEKNSFFANAASPSYSFNDGFELAPPVFSADYLLPVSLPLSLGLYFKTPSPNLKSFGFRAAYHINLNDRKTDLYLLYVFDAGFIRNSLLLEYMDEEQPLRFFDFRFGARRFFGGRFSVFIESEFKLSGFLAGVSLKLF